MATEAVVLLAVLRAIGARPAGHGYDRPAVEGVTREQIDAAVDELRRAGCVEATWIRHSFGPDVDRWEPSVLTARGRELLEKLEGGRQP